MKNWLLNLDRLCRHFVSSLKAINLKYRTIVNLVFLLSLGTTANGCFRNRMLSIDYLEAVLKQDYKTLDRLVPPENRAAIIGRVRYEAKYHDHQKCESAGSRDEGKNGFAYKLGINMKEVEEYEKFTTHYRCPPSEGRSPITVIVYKMKNGKTYVQEDLERLDYYNSAHFDEYNRNEVPANQRFKSQYRPEIFLTKAEADKFDSEISIKDSAAKQITTDFAKKMMKIHTDPIKLHCMLSGVQVGNAGTGCFEEYSFKSCMQLMAREVNGQAVGKTFNDREALILSDVERELEDKFNGDGKSLENALNRVCSK